MKPSFPFLLSVSFALCASALADEPLTEILRSASSLEEARAIALTDAAGTGSGPEYPSFPAPTSIPQLVTFSGTWTPYGNQKRLAIHADDGCRVTINGNVVLDEFKKGIPLPDMNRSFIVLPGRYAAGQSYTVKVEYSNVAYTGQGDIDGVTLYEFDSDHKIAVSFENDNDHLEADGTSTTKVRVRVTNDAGEALSGIPVELSTSLGTLGAEEMLTDGNGDAFVDSNGNGTKDTGEAAETTLTAGLVGGFATISAATPVSAGTNKVLLHKVALSDFSTPKFLKRASYSAPPELTNPQIAFTVGDAPAIGKKFRVTTTIYSLADHEPVTSKVEELAPGNYTRSWNDFFFQGETPVPGKSPDAGDGIFPYQIEVVPIELDAAKLDENEIVQRGIRAADWKASKSLVVKPKTSNVHVLSYDEETGKTYLTYRFDIESTAAVPVAPTDVYVDVYDPDLNKIATVNQFFEQPTVAADGRTFSYWVRGEVNLESAGDYHFVIEAKDVSDNKDKGKWALEQNSSATKPPYVAFGGKTPAENPRFPNVDVQGDFTWGLNKIADNLERIGFAKKTNKNRWWHPNYTGRHETWQPLGHNPSGVDAIQATGLTGIKDPSWTQIPQQTIQYNSVWVTIGHGPGGVQECTDGPNPQCVSNPDSGRFISFFKNGDLSMRTDSPEWSTAWSYVADKRAGISAGVASAAEVGNAMYLNELPKTYVGKVVKAPNGTKLLHSARHGVSARLAPLYYSNFVAFIGCGTSRDNVGTGLPRMAVDLGARAALGIRKSIGGNQGQRFAAEFFDKLRRGYSMEDARQYGMSYAQFDLEKGQLAVIVYRNLPEAGLRKLEAEWGDPYGGPEQ